MYYIKKLVLTILAVNILFGTNLSFRGNTKDQIIAQKIPLAFSNMILNQFFMMSLTVWDALNPFLRAEQTRLAEEQRRGHEHTS